MAYENTHYSICVCESLSKTWDDEAIKEKTERFCYIHTNLKLHKIKRQKTDWKRYLEHV